MDIAYKSTHRCRCCLTNNTFTSIYDPMTINGKIINYADIINKITTIEINELDEKPHYICEKCCEIARNAYKLRIICEQSDNILQNERIGRTTNENVIEIDEDLMEIEQLITDTEIKHELNEFGEENVELNNSNLKNILCVSQATNITPNGGVYENSNIEGGHANKGFVEDENVEVNKSNCKLKNKFSVRQASNNTQNGYENQISSIEGANNSESNEFVDENVEVNKFVDKNLEINKSNLKNTFCVRQASNNTQNGYENQILNIVGVNNSENNEFVDENVELNQSNLKSVLCVSQATNNTQNVGLYETSEDSHATNNIENNEAMDVQIENDVIIEYKCEKCNYTCDTERKLLAHEVVHRVGTNKVSNKVKEATTKCRLCEFVGTTRSNLQKHMEEKHFEDSKLFDCVQCNKTFLNQAQLNRHKRSHDAIVKNCLFCGFEGDCNALVQHTIERHPNRMDMKCWRCDMKFYTINRLRKHMKDVHEIPSNGCWCCEYVADNKLALTKHVNETHTDLKAFECTKCAKRFFDRSSLRKHLQTHNVRKDYVCEVCGRAFHVEDNLQKHRKLHTLTDNQFQCEVCGVAFKTRASLRMHGLVHSKRKDFVCDVCGRKFARNGQLMQHQYIHAKEKTHQCTVCEKRFASKKYLMIHVKMTHIGERNCECTICGRRFMRNAMLKRHLLTHTNDFKYTCDVCEEGFRSVAKLKEHVNEEHGENETSSEEEEQEDEEDEDFDV